MSRSAKKWLIAAALLVFTGLMIFIAVMTAYHWDFSRLSTDRFETNTYEISENFSNIKMNTGTADIIFAASDGNSCSVVCYEEENVKHSAQVKDGTLTVNVKDTRAWYEHIGINFHSPKITVYLPKAEYDSIAIKADTGDITAKNISADTLNISLSTGEITVSDITCTGDIKTSSSTGDVNLKNVTCKNLLSNGSTSNIYLKNVLAAEKFSIKRSTGDVKFAGSDAAEISVKTSTGDVTGSLLTAKTFKTKTSTGSIIVPKALKGGKCEITTSTGNILIKISDSADK